MKKSGGRECKNYNQWNEQNKFRKIMQSKKPSLCLNKISAIEVLFLKVNISELSLKPSIRFCLFAGWIAKTITVF